MGLIQTHKKLLANRAVKGVPPIWEENGTIASTYFATSLNVPYPSTVNADDILIMVVWRTVTYQTFSTPSGWTSIDSNSYPSRRVWWKRATGSESGTQTVSITNASDTTFGIMMRFSGCITSGTPYVEENDGYGGPSSYIQWTNYDPQTPSLGIAMAFTTTSASFSFTTGIPSNEIFNYSTGVCGSHTLESSGGNFNFYISFGGSRSYNYVGFWLIA